MGPFWPWPCAHNSVPSLLPRGLFLKSLPDRRVFAGVFAGRYFSSCEGPPRLRVRRSCTSAGLARAPAEQCIEKAAGLSWGPGGPVGSSFQVRPDCKVAQAGGELPAGGLGAGPPAGSRQVTCSPPRGSASSGLQPHGATGWLSVRILAAAAPPRKHCSHESPVLESHFL